MFYFFNIFLLFPYLFPQFHSRCVFLLWLCATFHPVNCFRSHCSCPWCLACSFHTGVRMCDRNVGDTHITGENRDSLEQRADKWTLLRHYSLTKSKCLALLLHFDHISDLSVLHDSVTLVKIICMLTERRRNANLLVSCRRALTRRHFRDIQISTALNANDVAACRFFWVFSFTILVTLLHLDLKAANRGRKAPQKSAFDKLEKN